MVRSFAYDGLRRRHTKTIASTTTDVLYDGLTPVQELSCGNVVANLLTALGIDEYFTRADAAGERNFLADALWRTVALTDSAAVVQTDYTNEPFGGTTVSGASTGHDVAFSGREATARACILSGSLLPSAAAALAVSVRPTPNEIPKGWRQ